MINIEIKEEFKSTIVGFNGSGLPLGKRSDADLVDLAQMAMHDKNTAKYFVQLPTKAEINAYKAEMLLQKHPVKDPLDTPDAE